MAPIVSSLEGPRGLCLVVAAGLPKIASQPSVLSWGFVKSLNIDGLMLPGPCIWLAVESLYRCATVDFSHLFGGYISNMARNLRNILYIGLGFNTGLGFLLHTIRKTS